MNKLGSCAVYFSMGIFLASADLASADAGESVTEDVHRALDVRIGIDALQGFSAVEYQHGHLGFSFGMPESYAVTYYNNPGRSSVFYRAGYTNWTAEDVTFCIVCDEESQNEMGRAAGLGIGYRLKGSTGLNFNVSIGVSYSEDPDRSPEREFGPWGGFTAGYAFSL